MIRYVTNDDPGQSLLARRFVDGHAVRVTWGVLLESEWVLRSAYGLSRERMAFVIRQFSGLPSVHVDDPEGFADVVGRFEQGMDFADAMHLVSCDDGDVLVTFDRRLKAAAGKPAAGKVKLLQA